ncbi:hypothetical protein QUF90_11250 [Desulfococcaceae bacterium HSG9]|nr:hypothetical protein [Desulfococcaceae bacterium HSG9]
MKYVLNLLIIGLILSVYGCENVSPDAVELSVDFSWKGMKPCGWGNPKIHVSRVPDKTKFLEVSMYDHAYSHDHGTVMMPYTGNGIIVRDRFKEIQGPCPMYTPGRYEIKIKAIDANKVVIGIGSKTRFFPEKK